MPDHEPQRDHIDEMRRLLRRHGLNVALRHLEEARAALDRGDREAANGQMRSFVQAVFDGAAAIRLRTGVTGGAARKQLEEVGLLSGYAARSVQSYMAWAGEKGSHAGLSEQAEAVSRHLTGLGIAYLGIGLIPDVVRVQEVMSRALTVPPGGRLATDAEVLTACPTCGQEQTLAEAALHRDGDETVYDCKNGCQPIAVVGLPGDIPWPGRGYRLKDFVIRNAADLRVRAAGWDGTVLIPASPAALMKQRPGAPAHPSEPPPARGGADP